MSRPLLVLSIATAFSDHLECTNETSDGSRGSHGNNDSHECSEPEAHAGPSSLHSTPDTRYIHKRVEVFKVDILQCFDILSITEKINRLTG